MSRGMRATPVYLVILGFLAVSLVFIWGAPSVRADEAKIKSALSAGPDSLTKNAAVQDWDGTVLREGTNGWTCLPDIPDNGGTDPWCLDETWFNFIKAMQTNTAPPTKKLGIGYMLAGDAPVSNLRPGDKEKTADNVWVEGIKAHMMIAVPDKAMIDNFSDDPNNGGPWVMWAGTPYVHLMVPIDSYPPQ